MDAVRVAFVVIVALVTLLGFGVTTGRGHVAAPSSIGSGSNPVVPTAPTSSSPTGPITPLAKSTSGLSASATTAVGKYLDVPESMAPPGVSPLPSELTAVVSLTPRASLENFVNELNDPNNPAYRKFVTIHDLGNSFGSSSYVTAASYFQSYGLSIQTSPDLLTLVVSGNPDQMAAAFHTTLTGFAREYQSQGMWNPLYGNESVVAGTTEYAPGFYANTGPLALPASLSGEVTGVVGFSGITAQPDFYPLVVHGPSVGPDQNNSTNGTSPVFPAATYPVVDDVQGLSGANFTWNPINWTMCYAWQVDCNSFQTLYPATMHELTGAENLWSGASTLGNIPDLGQGITIALIEVGCLDLATIQQFSSELWTNSSQPGLPLSDRITQIGLNIPGGALDNDNIGDCVTTGQDYGWTMETALDAEYAATMAPLAHIDIVATTSSDLTAFDAAYSDVAQYLTGGAGTLPASVGTVVAIGNTSVTSQSFDAPTGSVTITSNSYGESEGVGFFGCPMYLSVEDALLEEMNAVGVTNFFASGDDAAAIEGFGMANQAQTPAVSPGATSVGGGLATAVSNGQEFPVTSVTVNISAARAFAYVAPATGIGSFSYWSDAGISGQSGGTYAGLVGGGFGQSVVEPQPWWQNALDSYSSGAAIDPVVSGPAANNMTVFDSMAGGWNFFYGGTSFATPITAGEWALVEEQANVVFGNPRMGDINPLLYAAHNAYEAGVSSFHLNPFVEMQNIGIGPLWAPYNSYNWYTENLTMMEPVDPVIPGWFSTLFNPAGPRWNYLQGLGMIQASVIDQELFGQTSLPGFSLGNPMFQVEMVTGSGTLAPFAGETLAAGNEYTLEVVNISGTPGVYSVEAYSGQSSSGSYGGGTAIVLQTASDGRFTYTPTSGLPPGGDAATTYGYFLVTSVAGGEWSFADFAVGQPPATGSLELCVMDSHARCDDSSAEVTALTTFSWTGDYNGFPDAYITLNGEPATSAMLTEVSEKLPMGYDPSLPASVYLPGATIGHFVAGFTGDANFWVDAYDAEWGGTQLTQVVNLTASLDGLTSNTVTVFIEPQCGSFDASHLSLNAAGTAIDGNVTFSDMTNVESVNVSVGNAPGQYVNVTYPTVMWMSGSNLEIHARSSTGEYADWVVFIDGALWWQDDVNSGSTVGISIPTGTHTIELWFVPYFGEGTWSGTLTIGTVLYPFSGVDWDLPAFSYTTEDNGSTPLTAIGSGEVHVELSPLPPSGTPVAVNVEATGVNNNLFQICSSVVEDVIPTCTAIQGGVQSTIQWNFTTVFLPTRVTLDATESVTGIDNVTWTGTPFAGAIGVLSLVWAGGSGVLGTYALSPGDTTSGTLALNTTVLLDGTYLVTFTESAPDASLSTSEVSFYAANQQTSTDQLISTLESELSTDASTISSLQAQVASLEANLSSANATIASLESRVGILEGELSALQSELATAQTTITSLQAQRDVNATEVAALQANVTADLAKIASLQSEVQTLQSQVSAKNNYVAPAWYDALGSSGLVAIIAGVAVVVGIGAYFGGKRTGKRGGEASSSSDSKGRDPPRGDTDNATAGSEVSSTARHN